MKNKPKIIQVVKNFTESIKPFAVKTTGIVISEDGLIMVNFKINKELYHYHLQALKMFNPLRERKLREKYQDEEYFASLSKVDQRRIIRYGHRWILDKYHPHITIAAIKDLINSREVIREYRNCFKGKTAKVVALRIAQEFWEPENKTVIVFDQPFVHRDTTDRIKELLRSRERTKKRLEEVEVIFREEKENEEFWPGHASTRYQMADSDHHVFLEHLALIDKELKKLGYDNTLKE